MAASVYCVNKISYGTYTEVAEVSGAEANRTEYKRKAGAKHMEINSMSVGITLFCLPNLCKINRGWQKLISFIQPRFYL